MPTNSLERLMFVQGGLCFFCKQPLSKADASVEHLLASANAGNNHDDNCVACCKSFNALLGSMSLKEKFQVVLNQKGQFKCPNSGGSLNPPRPDDPKAKQSVPSKSKADRFTMVVANLKQRGVSRPHAAVASASAQQAIGRSPRSSRPVSTRPSFPTLTPTPIPSSTATSVVAATTTDQQEGDLMLSNHTHQRLVALGLVGNAHRLALNGDSMRKITAQRANLDAAKKT